MSDTKNNEALVENITLIESYLYTIGTLMSQNTSLKTKESRMEFGKLMVEMSKVVRASKMYDEARNEELLETIF